MGPAASDSRVKVGLHFPTFTLNQLWLKLSLDAAQQVILLVISPIHSMKMLVVLFIGKPLGPSKLFLVQKWKATWWVTVKLKKSLWSTSWRNSASSANPCGSESVLKTMLIDAETGIIYREDSWGDNFILHESKGYFPLGLLPTDRVLDWGGHVGCFSARAKIEQPAAVVNAIEAEQTNWEVLAQNAVKFNFSCYLGAVVGDDLDGQQITLYVNIQKNNAAHSILPTRGRVEQKVVGIGFSRALHEFKPTVLKVDIEGSEMSLNWSLLAQESQLRLVVMELHLLKKGHRGKAVEIAKLFQDLGFTCTREPVVNEKNWTTLGKWQR